MQPPLEKFNSPSFKEGKALSSITIVANIILVPETLRMILYNYLLAHLAILYLVIVLVFKTTDFQRGSFGNTNSIGTSDVSLVNFFLFNTRGPAKIP